MRQSGVAGEATMAPDPIAGSSPAMTIKVEAVDTAT
jgi:hypothetical protein